MTTSFSPFSRRVTATAGGPSTTAGDPAVTTLTPEQIAANEAAAHAQAEAEAQRLAQANADRTARLAAAAAPSHDATRDYRRGFKAGGEAMRARVRAIISSPVALHNPEGALIMACDTDMEVGAVIAVLQSSATGRRPAASAEPSALDRRMAATPQPKVGPGSPEPQSGTATAIADFIKASYNEAIGTPRRAQ